jgi:serine/threonine protein kinase
MKCMSIDAGTLPQSLGPYRIVRQIGQGGMGVVYEAVHESISRRVAIKLLHSEYAHNSQVAQRFFNEARAVNLIEHPALVQISEFGQLPDGSTYLVMELLKGENLASRLRRVGALPLPAVLQIGSQLAEALCAAHEKGIVHRDLKPENVMLVADSAVLGGERVKLLDFGIAKLAEGGPNRTATSALMGTPKYMSPEQARGAGSVDEKTDVYALGVMLFELLAGKPPFEGESGELIAKHLYQPPPSLASLSPTLPDVVVQIIARLLGKDRQQRPTMAAAHRELTEQLRTFREHDFPASAPPPRSGVSLPPRQDQSTLGSTASQLSQSGQARPARRRATFIALGVAVVALGIGGWTLLRGARQTPTTGAAQRPESLAAGAEQRAQPPSASPTDSTAQRRVHWSIKTTPPAAQVVRATDKQELGQTPWSLDVPADSADQELVVRLKGYQDQTLRFRGGVDAERELNLEPRPDAKKEVRAKGGHKPPTRSTEAPSSLFAPKAWMKK